jgi:hypothetical protein
VRPRLVYEEKEGADHQVRVRITYILNSTVLVTQTNIMTLYMYMVIGNGGPELKSREVLLNKHNIKECTPLRGYQKSSDKNRQKYRLKE